VTPPGSLAIEAEDPATPDAASLMNELAAEMFSRYPAESVHSFDPETVHQARCTFVVARLGGRAVGCGAVCPLEEPSLGEIKSMYVRPEARGRGVARGILERLEEVARGHAYTRLRLETGAHQPEAMALYESFGYRRTERFGEYADDPFSVCYEKGL